MSQSTEEHNDGLQLLVHETSKLREHVGLSTHKRGEMPEIELKHFLSEIQALIKVKIMHQWEVWVYEDSSQVRKISLNVSNDGVCDTLMKFISSILGVWWSLSALFVESECEVVCLRF